MTQDASAGSAVKPASLDMHSQAHETESHWRATVHTDHAPLEPSWRQLEAQGHCTVFQTYDWAACWYDAVKAGGLAEPVIVVVWKGTEPVWILPLCMHRKRGLRVISFADLHISDYGAPLFAHDAPRETREIKAIMKSVLRALPPCDVVHLQKLPSEIEGRPNPLLSLSGQVRFPANCYGIELSRPWPELAKQIMQRRLRSTIRQKRKQIEKLGPVSFEHEDDPNTIEPAMNRLMDMRRTRFEAIGRANTPAVWRGFYHDLATRHERQLGVSVSTISVSGEPIATCFGLTRGNTYCAILPTFVMEEWKNFRPGMLLFDAMLEQHAARTNGDGYFDFTIGDEPYKMRFGGVGQPLFEWMRPMSARGAAAYLVWRAKARLRRYPELTSEE